jgi:hypothetical protein
VFCLWRLWKFFPFPKNVEQITNSITPNQSLMLPVFKKKSLLQSKSLNYDSSFFKQVFHTFSNTC